MVHVKHLARAWCRVSATLGVFILIIATIRPTLQRGNLVATSHRVSQFTRARLCPAHTAHALYRLSSLLLALCQEGRAAVPEEGALHPGPLPAHLHLMLGQARLCQGLTQGWVPGPVLPSLTQTHTRCPVPPAPQEQHGGKAGEAGG